MRFNDYAFVAGLTAVAVLCTCESARVRLAAVAWIAVVLAASMINRRHNTFRMDIVATDAFNEILALQCRLAGRRMMFMLDTGYAGPPVLSASYLAVREPAAADPAARYLEILQRLSAVSVDDQSGAINAFLRESGCSSYTSGCTMRLMGIGATQEQQADMFMCEMLRIKTKGGAYASPRMDASHARADVFVTNALPGSIHILTCDFLLHCSPALISISARELRLNMGINEELYWRSVMTLHPLSMSGGAFVVTILVGGASLRCTVDTGSPGPICLSADAAARLRVCLHPDRATTVRQSGVNAEEICSQVVAADVEFGKARFSRVPIFLNDTSMDQVDGYVGLGFLRAFDMIVARDAIGFARNGLEMASLQAYADAGTPGVCAELRGVQCK